MSQWNCHSARNPNHRSRKTRKIERMIERLARARGTKPPPSLLEAEWKKEAAAREVEILQIQQQREREYFDLRKPPLPAVVAALALIGLD